MISRRSGGSRSRSRALYDGAGAAVEFREDIATADDAEQPPILDDRQMSVALRGGCASASSAVHFRTPRGRKTAAGGSGSAIAVASGAEPFTQSEAL
jgi:hypothetical protein